MQHFDWFVCSLHFRYFFNGIRSQCQLILVWYFPLYLWFLNHLRMLFFLTLPWWVGVEEQHSIVSLFIWSSRGWEFSSVTGFIPHHWRKINNQLIWSSPSTLSRTSCPTVVYNCCFRTTEHTSISSVTVQPG